MHPGCYKVTMTHINMEVVMWVSLSPLNTMYEVQEQQDQTISLSKPQILQLDYICL